MIPSTFNEAQYTGPLRSLKTVHLKLNMHRLGLRVGQLFQRISTLEFSDQ